MRQREVLEKEKPNQINNEDLSNDFPRRARTRVCTKKCVRRAATTKGGLRYPHFRTSVRDKAHRETGQKNANACFAVAAMGAHS